MLYAIPANLTDGHYSTGWNRQLSETDKNFIARAYPAVGQDISAFSTMEVRPGDSSAREAVKRQTFPEAYSQAPMLAVGLTWLDVDSSTNIRVKAFADNITAYTADMHINTWNDTTLYSAACTWFRVKANDQDYQAGEFSTEEDHPPGSPQAKTSRDILFDRPYASPPKVVVWLKMLDMAHDHNWRITATATKVTAKGFTINLDTWFDTVLYAAAASWIAYPSDKPGVVSGTFDTQDVRPVTQPRLKTTGRVTFPAGSLSGTPTVLMALNSLDIGHNHNLRLKLGADSISQDGMNWHIDGWYDTVVHSAGVSYIAFT